MRNVGSNYILEWDGQYGIDVFNKIDGAWVKNNNAYDGVGINYLPKNIEAIKFKKREEQLMFLFDAASKTIKRCLNVLPVEVTFEQSSEQIEVIKNFRVNDGYLEWDVLHDYFAVYFKVDDV